MLTQILQRAQAFERRHGRRPNTLFVTQKQYFMLRQEYPEVLGDTPEIVLGLRITLAPDHSLLQPEIAWLPARVPGYLRQRKSMCRPAAIAMGEDPDLPDSADGNQVQ